MDAVVDDLVTKEGAARQTTLAEYKCTQKHAARAAKMHQTKRSNLPSTATKTATTTTATGSTVTTNQVRVNLICNGRMLKKQHHVSRQWKRNTPPTKSPTGGTTHLGFEPKQKIRSTQTDCYVSVIVNDDELKDIHDHLSVFLFE